MTLRGEVKFDPDAVTVVAQFGDSRNGGLPVCLFVIILYSAACGYDILYIFLKTPDYNENQKGRQSKVVGPPPPPGGASRESIWHVLLQIESE
jgi:hypothetical protein